MDKKIISKSAFYYTLILIILSLIPLPDLGVPKFKLFETDKLVHFSMYTIFAIIWGLKSDNKSIINRISGFWSKKNNDIKNAIFEYAKISM